ncbi:MAG: 30S ribosomal protein S1 [Nitrospirae bacterium]|nr:30S ribosomal protein S1 [Nitrospirota bacterium]
MEMQAKEETRDIEKLYAETLHRVERGGIAKGKIIAVKNDGVVVDVGYKSEGIIPSSEFTGEEFSLLKEGDFLEVYVEKINDRDGIVTLSRERASKILAWESLVEAYNNKSKVEGKIVGKTKGGLFADINGIKAFLPSSQIDIKMVKDVDSYIGRTALMKIVKISAPRGHAGGTNHASGQISGASVVVSRRAVIEDERNIKKDETLKILKEGALLKGIVKNITDYGVFIDLGGIDGLLHISDISWRRVNHPSEFFSAGHENEFIVLKYDADTEKVTLGYKQKRPDPWLSVDEKYKQGMRLKGKVMTVTDYGVFVEIEEGLEGLIHISELDWAPRPKHPSKYVSVGDEIEAVVISVNKNERKLSLSLKQLKSKPWDVVGEVYRIGQTITGKVKTLTDFGAFVRLPEGIDGLIHISDISWIKHIKHPSEILRKGQKVEAVILSLEPDKERMALGIKQLTPDPWQDEIPAKCKLGEELKGKALRITDFGIFVEMEGGIEGLVYSSEVDASKDVKEGDEIFVRIIKVNTEERKIGLSMKNVKSHES